LEILSVYEFVVKHFEGTKNPGDGPSRRPDYEIGYERHVVRPLTTLSMKLYHDYMPAIFAAQASDPLAFNIPEKLVD
jgi:hypothetical protein